MQIRAVCICAVLLLCIAGTGCTGQSVGSEGADVRGSPAANTSGGALVPGPTQTIPQYQEVEVQINEKDTSYATLEVIFAGGRGMSAVKNVEVRFTTADGKISIQMLKPEKGSSVVFQGTRDTDRVEVTVNMNDGKSNRIIDRPVPYRTRG